MPAVDGLTEQELAERSGASAEQLLRLVDLGILVRQEDGAFRPADIQRVRLMASLEASGISPDDVGRAIRLGHLSLSFLDLLFTNPQGYTSKTYQEICAEFGWSIDFVERAHEALGLPPPVAAERVREDDMHMFPAGQFALATGMSEAEVLRALRVYGENLSRIAQAESQLFHSYVEEPLLQSGMAEGQLLDVASQVSPGLRQNVEGLIWWLYHRHQEHAIIEHVAAMVFLDLAGYTRLTEERGDEAAAELAAVLAGLVQRESRRRGGRPIKWLGDGVMFHFPDPAEAVLSSLELVERTPASGLPPAHVGVNAGPVVFRDGDYFGRTVNIAARIAARAGPGEVVVSDEVARVCRPDGVRFDELGPVELKGVTRAVRLFQASWEA